MWAGVCDLGTVCTALVVLELLDAIRPILTEHCEGKIDEAHFLIPDNFGKFAVSMDEMFCGVRKGPPLHQYGDSPF